MLDHFIFGEVSRISPEAPIPIVRMTSEQSMLGGLGNVVRNLGALGCKTVVFSVTGEDSTGKEVSALLNAVPGCEAKLSCEAGRTTPLKVRYLAHGQQLLRADKETIQPISSTTLAEMVTRFEASIAGCSVIMLSDYAKGTLTGESAREFIKIARSRGKPVIVDPKGSDFERYLSATLIKPNMKELADATGMRVDTTTAQEAAARRLIERTNAQVILVTRGANGMLLVTRESRAIEFPALAREVFEVSGAGDTVAAALAAAIGTGVGMSEAVDIANIAAGIVVGKVGTAIVNRAEIVQEIDRQSAFAASDKVVRLDEAIERARGWRQRKLRVGVVVGAFGQISMENLAALGKARQYCDRLLVLLQSDSTLQPAKVVSPGQDEHTRAYVLASMVFSDAVVVCDEQTSVKLLSTVLPDVFISMDDVRVSAAWREGWEGKVVALRDCNAPVLGNKAEGPLLSRYATN
jgi:D-beta-D-heptose 7-phosphate kinase/D-beta-D-heptose 1-phosphate adenosyltransferase